MQAKAVQVGLIWALTDSGLWLRHLVHVVITICLLQDENKNEQFFTYLKSQFASGALSYQEFTRLMEAHLENLRDNEEDTTTTTSLVCINSAKPSIVKVGVVIAYSLSHLLLTPDGHRTCENSYK